MESDTPVTAAVRDLWPHEANDFTPWLLRNGGLLAAVLGIELELESSEFRVGPFALDLKGRDTTNDCVLIVENQLEPTDHSHLGQLLTYAAGTNAATVVWVATFFRSEHGRALEWMNHISDKAVRFCGVEIYAENDGETLVPHLRLVVGPSHAFKPTASSTSARRADDATGALRAEFFNAVLDRLRAGSSTFRFAGRGATTAGSRMVEPIPKGDIWCTFLPSQGRIRVDLHVHHADKTLNHAIFDQLYAHRSEIEAHAGAPLSWDRDVVHGPGCRVAIVIDGTVSDPERREENIDWCARQVLVLAEATQKWA